MRRGVLLYRTAAFHNVRVLYGSQTGNAQYFATLLSEKLQEQKWNVALGALDEAAPEEVVKESDPLIVVCSVFGEGEPPDNAQKFFKALTEKPLERSEAAGQYSVFGLGNSHYAETRFNITGKIIDDRLEVLGRKRLLPFLPGDAADDIEGQFEGWMDQLLQKLGQGEAEKQQLNYDRVVLSDKAPTSVSFYRPFDQSVWSMENPMPMSCLGTRSVLSASAPPPNVRACKEVLFTHPELQYVTGDYVGLYPLNQRMNVEKMVTQFRLPPQSYFELEGFESAISSRRRTFPRPVKVVDFLTKFCDLQRPLPLASVRKLLNWVDTEDAKRIKAAIEDKNIFRETFWFASVPDVLSQFFTLQIGLAELVEILPPPKPVYYSIASSSKVHPKQIRLVVGHHRFSDAKNAVLLDGLCSTYLTQSVQQGDTVEGLVRQSVFRLPEDPSTPIIMIGVASGIAPFLGFIEERLLDQKGGDNLLFYGCMRADWDLLYASELKEWKDSGRLDLNVAFSHQNPDRMVFAQHLLDQRGEQIFRLLQEGAYVYVCGHTRLGAGVEETLKSILGRGFQGDEGKALSYLDMLYESGRLKLDVFA